MGLLAPRRVVLRCEEGLDVVGVVCEAGSSCAVWCREEVVSLKRVAARAAARVVREVVVVVSVDVSSSSVFSPNAGLIFLGLPLGMREINKLVNQGPY